MRNRSPSDNHMESHSIDPRVYNIQDNTSMDDIKNMTIREPKVTTTVRFEVFGPAEAIERLRKWVNDNTWRKDTGCKGFGKARRRYGDLNVEFTIYGQADPVIDDVFLRKFGGLMVRYGRVDCTTQWMFSVQDGQINETFEDGDGLGWSGRPGSYEMKTDTSGLVWDDDAQEWVWPDEEDGETFAVPKNIQHLSGEETAIY